MDFKENLNASQRTNMFQNVKSEPQEPRIAPLGQNQAWPGFLPVSVKSELGDAARPLNNGVPSASTHANNAFGTNNAASTDTSLSGAAKPEDMETRDASNDAYSPPHPPASALSFSVHQTAADIMYKPENALTEGLGMVRSLKTNIKKLQLGSKLREEVWLREIESLQNQGAPTTMIAVCGATGAGKSSILNAILDDNIVPTSGMRACTAVVTEISHHTKKTIEANVSFLSEAEWRTELTVLLDDLVDEDGNLKRSTDLRSDAGIAWQKVHAVYPSLTQEQLIRLTVEQIIARDQRVAKILGTTKHIIANNSKTFGKEIGKYIDSKDKKQSDKSKKKDKPKQKDEKGKEKGKSLIEQMREQNKKKNAALGIVPLPTSSKEFDDDPDGPAFWPLIRQVQVKCNAAALSTGAILVDLPGVADANAARSNIAKDYMKKCDCIWILAPITRAVDDKTARDLMGDAFKMQLMNGNYDDNAITFIATKCDDISCSEVIRALQLEDHPDLEEIEGSIDQCNAETEEWKDKKSDAEHNAKATDKLLKQLRAHLSEYQEQLEALRNGESFTPKLTAKSKPQKSKKRKTGSDNEDFDGASESNSPSKKRKNKRGGKRGSPKKRKGIEDEDSDDFMDDDDDLVFSDSGSETERGSDSGRDDESSDEDESGTESDQDDDEEDEVTEDSLKAQIEEVKASIKQGRVDLSEFRRLRKEAMDAIASLKKKLNKAQREKNAFCSLKRSEFSRGVLKEDFRVGLKDLDDAAAEEKDPNNFDPTVNLRDYAAIDLPVFTCSSRDYVRLKGQVQGDGDSSCFSKIEDTGVPALQEWCHHLTVASRERAARNFLMHLKTFANSIKVYIEGVVGVTAADREALREKWESSEGAADDDDDDDSLNIFSAGWGIPDDPLDLPGLAMLADPLGGGLYSMNRKAPKVDRFGEPVGVTPRLVKDFAEIVDDCVDDLKKSFTDGLEEKCHTGAANAASAAVETSDTFAASMHWATYRATLRRLGEWRQDLNVELSTPFTRQIASTWAKVFEADLFAGFEKAANNVITKLLKDVEESAPIGLKERARGQAELALEEARVALGNTIDVVRNTINDEQKEVSRCLAPHVQVHLTDGYHRAMEERGKGSVARQKNLFHNVVAESKNDMFDDAADVILGRLASAAEAVGKALGQALQELAEKIEVSVAVLWEGAKNDPAQVRARAEVISVVNDIAREVQLWQEAARLRSLASAPANGSA